MIFAILKLKTFSHICKRVCSFDDDNNKIGRLRQNWGNSGWMNQMIWTYTYDENNNRIEYLWQTWGWDYSEWVNSFRYTYAYDEMMR